MIAICNNPNILKTSIESNVLNKQNCCALNQAELRSPHPLNNGGGEVGSQMLTQHPSLCRTQGTCQQPPCLLSLMEESPRRWITSDCERRGLRSGTLSFLNPNINSQLTGRVTEGCSLEKALCLLSTSHTQTSQMSPKPHGNPSPPVLMNTYYVPGTSSDPRKRKNLFPVLKEPL